MFMRRYLASVAIKETEIKARPYVRIGLPKHRMNGRVRGREGEGEGGEGKGEGEARGGKETCLWFVGGTGN